jgi:hypothetical protein
MSAPKLEVLPGLHSAVAGVVAITSKLGTFNGAPSIHTRRPAPLDAGYPMVMIGPIAARGEEDEINRHRPVVSIDITTYGTQGTPNTPADQYRTVEAIADLIYTLFHREQRAFTVPNYQVWQVTCTGPSPAPVDDDSRVGRRVTLSIRLRAQ